jgi:urocanate hydratase
MYRFRPDYEMRARLKNTLGMRTGKGYYADDPEQSRLCRGATSSRTNHIWWSCFQNWAQYLTMKYLSEMTDQQTLTMYSGHPMGLFPSHKEAKGSCYKRNGNP